MVLRVHAFGAFRANFHPQARSIHLEEFLAAMSSTTATASQQGVTKTLTGSNASFNDKVIELPRWQIFANLLYRENPWNFGYRTWSQPKVQANGCPI